MFFKREFCEDNAEQNFFVTKDPLSPKFAFTPNPWYKEMPKTDLNSPINNTESPLSAADKV
jgi:hypothetical protein